MGSLGGLIMENRTYVYKNNYDDLIGKTFNEAMALYPSMQLRVVYEDGVHYVQTMDFRFDRLNLDLEDGLITKAELG